MIGMRMKTSFDALAAGRHAFRVPDFSFSSTIPESSDDHPEAVHSRRLPIEEMDYYGECRPSGTISGEFFDFVPLGARALLLSLGDVSRHGSSAAVILSGIKAFLRNTSTQPDEDLAGLIQSLNRGICDLSPEDVHATLFTAQVDPVHRRLRYVNAGHEPALLFQRNTGHLRRLERTGTVLGLTDRASYRQPSILLEPGACLVAFTDGITEATDPEGREFRERGVRSVLEQYPDASARELCEGILEAVTRFQQSAAADDQTVAVVRLVDTVTLPQAERAEELAFAAA